MRLADFIFDLTPSKIFAMWFLQIQPVPKPKGDICLIFKIKQKVSNKMNLAFRCFFILKEKYLMNWIQSTDWISISRSNTRPVDRITISRSNIQSADRITVSRSNIRYGDQIAISRILFLSLPFAQNWRRQTIKIIKTATLAV